MAKRSGKFYYKNEKQTLKSLGLKQVPGSGNGWVHKEDGENEYVLAQLKSTDAKSISLKLLDIEKLEYHANVSHKIPVFIVQFLKSNDVFRLARPLDMPALAEYIKTGICEKNIKTEIELIDLENEPWPEVPKVPVNKVKSSGKGRKKFWEDKKELWENRKK